MRISELITELERYDGSREIYVWDWLQSEHVSIDCVSLFDSEDKHSNSNPLGISIYSKEEQLL